MSTPRFAAHADAGNGQPASLAHEVAAALQRTPRQLPTHALYDALGSALFDAICCLPWYRITRTEQALLAAHAAEIHALAGGPRLLVEFGPGNGSKLETLLVPVASEPVRVELVDVSGEALARAASRLSLLPGLDVWLYQHGYDVSLARLAQRPHTKRTMLVFLGSNIGNFDAAAAADMLRAMRSSVSIGDALLLGVDLVKPEADLQLAYDDPLGVTAAFNRNLLVRLNRDLGANFDVGRFAHRATWNADASRIEMHLVSTARQRVTIPPAAIDITFEDGETIWTESSYKYQPAQVGSMLAVAGFSVTAQWVADGFALTLGRAQ